MVQFVGVIIKVAVLGYPTDCSTSYDNVFTTVTTLYREVRMKSSRIVFSHSASIIGYLALNSSGQEKHIKFAYDRMNVMSGQAFLSGLVFNDSLSTAVSPPKHLHLIFAQTQTKKQHPQCSCP